MFATLTIKTLYPKRCCKWSEFLRQNPSLPTEDVIPKNAKHFTSLSKVWKRKNNVTMRNIYEIEVFSFVTIYDLY